MYLQQRVIKEEIYLLGCADEFGTVQIRIRKILASAKVDNFQSTTGGDHEIFWLDIPMRKAKGMDVFEALGKIMNIKTGEGFRNG